MNGWAKARGDPVTNAEHVQALFDRHVQHYQTSGQRPDCRPNHVAYATLIHGWTKTRTVSAAYKAEGLLQNMYVEFQKEEEAHSNSKNKLGADRIIPNTQLITSGTYCLLEHWRMYLMVTNEFLVSNSCILFSFFLQSWIVGKNPVLPKPDNVRNPYCNG